MTPPRAPSAPSAARRAGGWGASARRELRAWLQAIAVALIATTFVATTVGVAGPSMAPTLDGSQRSRLEGVLFGDRLLVTRLDAWLRRVGVLGDIERGAVVVAREPADSPLRDGPRRAWVVKRLVAGPGDVVEMRAGRMFVNGTEIDQGWLREVGVALGRDTLGPLRLGDDEVFLVGDNRTRSFDSRAYGPVPLADVIGRARAIVLPLRRHGAWYPRVLAAPEAFEAVPDAAPGAAHAVPADGEPPGAVPGAAPAGSGAAPFGPAPASGGSVTSSG